MNDKNLRRMAAAEAEVIAVHFGVSSSDSHSDSSDSTARKIWDKLTAAGLTEAGAAGLMGNLKAESDLEPQNVQNSFERKIGYDDRGYTEAVDFGSYTNFANDGAGYGLAQWTYPARKAALLAFAKAQKKSVGDLDLQLDFLLTELQKDYPALLRQLCAASDVRAASDAVLTQFERPADMSESVKIKRAGFAEAFLREFGGQENAVADALQGVLEIGGKRYEVTLIEA
jgi:hypothetical protein